jgi:hypothetical protein
MILSNYTLGFKIKRFFLAVLIVFLGSSIGFSQTKKPPVKEKTFYIGVGTSISSFLGGEFGNRFQIRYGEDEYNYDGYNYDYGPSYSLSPVQIAIVAGKKLNENISLELEASFFNHTKGFIDNRDITTGSNAGTPYYDSYERAKMLSIPLIASVKYFPGGRTNSGIYLTAGAGYAYMRESIERVRTLKYFDNYYYYYYYSKQTLASYSDHQWLPVMKLAGGTKFDLFGTLAGDVELTYTNFKTVKEFGDPLTTGHGSAFLQNIALTGKFFFDL